MVATGGRGRCRARLVLWGVIALVLLLPLVAMQFTDEVDWDATDFGFAAAPLIGDGAAYELATIRVSKAAHRAAIGSALLVLVLLAWAQAAVGIL